MPPKRKLQLTISSDSESDKVSLRRPKETSVLPAIMRNIELLKAKRDKSRKDIAAKFNTYVSNKKKEIESRHASEAEKKSTELKDILTRYIQALEQSASIEKSIADIISQTDDHLDELNLVLKAAYSGRQRVTHAAAGSFSSIPRGPKTTASTNTRTGTNVQNIAQADRDEKEGRARNGDLPHAGKENVFDEITW